MSEKQQHMIKELWSNLRFDHSFLTHLESTYNKYSGDFDIHWKWEINAMKYVIHSKLGELDQALKIAQYDIAEIDPKKYPQLYMVRATAIAKFQNNLEQYQQNISFIEDVIFNISQRDRIGIYLHYVNACGEISHTVPNKIAGDIYLLIEKFGNQIQKSDVVDDYARFYDGYRQDSRKYSALMVEIQDLKLDESNTRLQEFIKACKTKFFRNEAKKATENNS